MSSTGQGLWSPRFILCPSARHRTCSVGSLATGRAVELEVRNHIGVAAMTGEQVSLTVDVQGAGFSPAEATLTTLVGQQSASPSPSTTLFPTPTYSYPALPSLPQSTVTPGSLTTLFPVVTPTPSQNGRALSHHRSASIAPTASTLPLDPRLIGGQLAGLAVLAAAITMAVARLSLRTTASSGASGQDAGVPAADDDRPPRD